MFRARFEIGLTCYWKANIVSWSHGQNINAYYKIPRVLILEVLPPRYLKQVLVYITIEHRSTIHHPKVEAIFLVLRTPLNIPFLINASRIDLTCPKRLSVHFDSVLKIPMHHDWFNTISIASL